jgi:acetylornithine deacetylase/succinyl-diaminopimelate desuccinylase-like protein
MRRTTLGAKLTAIDYTGSLKADCHVNPISCHLELHIEQDRNLQDSGRRAGVVTAIQGIRWFRVQVRGEQGHAGSTPMAGRADAFLATAKIEVLLDKLAREKGALATVGMIEHGRRGCGSSNTIPGSAQFTIDLRSPTETTIVEIVDELEKEMNRLERENTKLVSSVDSQAHQSELIPDKASVFPDGASLAQSGRRIRPAAARLRPQGCH